jgi:hypothetical protein
LYKKDVSPVNKFLKNIQFMRPGAFRRRERCSAGADWLVGLKKATANDPDHQWPSSPRRGPPHEQATLSPNCSAALILTAA